MVHDLTIVPVLHISEAVASGDRFGFTVLVVEERIVAGVDQFAIDADPLIPELNRGVRQRLEGAHDRGPAW
jgi:hypothetical protein